MKRSSRKRVVAHAVLALGCFFLHAASARALEGSLSLANPDNPGSSGGNEFVSGNFPGAVLMPINLWGAVGKPGIHHIPVKTDLVTLLSLAGGPTAEAELEDVVIKRRSQAQEQIIEIDVDKLMRKPGMKSPQLEANDIVVIPRYRPTINNNTAQTVGFIGSIISVVLAGIVLGNQVNR